MNNKLSKITINQAAQWYARLHAPDCSESDHAAFKSWLAGGAERIQAYQSVIDSASLISRQIEADPRLRAMVSDALQPPKESSLTKTSLVGVRRYAVAAAVLVFVSLTMLFTLGQGNSIDGAGPLQYYVNHELNRQRIALDDGSIVYLDVGAKLSVEMTPHQRNLQLEAGRAFFEVAHDKSRPFMVSHENTRVVALGTKFQVDVVAENKIVNVTLAEGSVEVASGNQADTWREVLVPGQQLLIDNWLNRHQVIQVKTDTVTSWSTGFLVFDGIPLHKALEEINRYSTVKIVLGDSSLSEIPIAGNFMAGGNSDDFIKTLAAVLPLRSTRTEANEIVLFEKYGAQNP